MKQQAILSYNSLFACCIIMKLDASDDCDFSTLDYRVASLSISVYPIILYLAFLDRK